MTHIPHFPWAAPLLLGAWLLDLLDAVAEDDREVA